VADIMRLGDFFIGKPGPGSLSEALHLGLPIITVKNVWTMPQERYNAEWVQAHGLGVVLTSMRHLRSGVDEVLAQLPKFQARVRRLDNRAVFELPEIFANLMHAGATPQPGAAPARPDGNKAPITA
jgi:1,2-diacylglycerol 3-beta-galactosyltransferase